MPKSQFRRVHFTAADVLIRGKEGATGGLALEPTNKKEALA